MKLDAPLFSLSYGRYVSYSKFQSKFKGLIAKLSLHPDLYSSHSFRWWGGTFDFRSGSVLN